MNWKQTFRLLGTVQLIIASFMVIPTLLAVYFKEWLAFNSFLVTLAIILIYVTVILIVGRRWESDNLSIANVYFFITLTYIVATTLGAIPLYLSKTTVDFASAFMEMASGFSTTGLTTLINIEASFKSILFWRSMSNWLGGMGIIVLFVALLPIVGQQGVQLYTAEVVGPDKSKLTPKIKDSALVLWLTYLTLTTMETILLLIGKVGLFDAVTISLGTISTGGFAPKNNSIEYYNSAYVDIVITIFMLLGGINFALYYAIIKGKFKKLFSDLELKVYLAIFFSVFLLITVTLMVQGNYNSVGTALRHASFNSASILTTTGFSNSNYNNWPYLAQGLLLILMLSGGSSGSTSGGIKVSRLVTMFKLAGQNIRTMLHPKGRFTIQRESEKIPWRAVNAITGFIALYLTLILASTLVVASAGYDLTTSLSSALTSVGNIGLGFGAVGPGGISFSLMPSYVKWFLSIMMLAGRLEIYTIVALFSRNFWSR